MTQEHSPLVNKEFFIRPLDCPFLPVIFPGDHGLMRTDTQEIVRLPLNLFIANFNELLQTRYSEKALATKEKPPFIKPVTPRLRSVCISIPRALGAGKHYQYFDCKLDLNTGIVTARNNPDSILKKYKYDEIIARYRSVLQATGEYLGNHGFSLNSH